MMRFIVRSVFGLALLVGLMLPGRAHDTAPDRSRNQPGQFAFYVLALSWAPSYCAAAAVHSPGRVPALECGMHAYGFVVHGLWPQYDRGFPRSCQVPAPRLDRALVSAMLDLMPSPRLVYSEWDRHGTCSGLSPRGYFGELRKARAAVKIPRPYRNLQLPLEVAPTAVTKAFIDANPGLAPGDIAIACQAKRLTEVRLCLTKDLKFRACPDVVAHACRRQHLLMPPLRRAAADSAGGRKR